MKAAFAYWHDRIAPVFDNAGDILLIETDDRRIVNESRCSLPLSPLWLKSQRLLEMRCDTLICGAISRAFLNILSASGIHVVPFVAGDLQTVVNGWIDGTLADAGFSMPGCRRWCRQRGRGGPGRRGCNGISQ